MDRDLLSHLPIIICVARHRSFAAAAAELGMSPSAVSHAVRSVEDRLGTPLFARTTRSVSLTEAGTLFIAGVEPALADIGKTVEGLSAERGQLTGLLRIDSPSAAVFDMALIPILASLARQHPRLTVEIRTGQFSADIVAQGFDAGIRIRRAIQQDMMQFLPLLLQRRSSMRPQAAQQARAHRAQALCRRAATMTDIAGRPPR